MVGDGATQITDVAGNVLDGEFSGGFPSGDGGPGGDFLATFTVNDTVPLRVVQHVPSGDIAGTVDAVDVIFNEQIDPGSFTTADPPGGLSDTVQVLGVGSSATPGFLQPGESGQIPVYYRGLKMPWSWDPVEFTLGALTADDTTPIDWSTLNDAMQPEWMATDGWDAIAANLADPEFIGTTWGNYVTMLADNINYLHSVGQEVTDIATLWGFEIAQASAALSPYRYLAGAVDADSPARGLPLVFSRVYGQSIAARYELGPLGRGWSHNWDIRIEELSDGDVLLRGSGGVDRFFSRNDDGSFSPSRGDYAELTSSAGTYRLTEKHGTVWQFRSDDLLDYVEDTNANRITVGYTSGRLTSLVYSNGDSLTLSYDQGRISQVTDPAGRRCFTSAWAASSFRSATARGTSSVWAMTTTISLPGRPAEADSSIATRMTRRATSSTSKTPFADTRVCRTPTASTTWRRESPAWLPISNPTSTGGYPGRPRLFKINSSYVPLHGVVTLYRVPCPGPLTRKLATNGSRCK